MAKRYGDLADALEKLSTHYRLIDRGRLAKDYQDAASTLRMAEHIPPDPSDDDGIPTTTRDSIAKWRALGRIPELDELEKERPYLTNLTKIAKVGPTTAKRLNEEAGAVDIEDIRELDENDGLEDVTGIGPKTATTIRRSISQM